MTLLIAAPNASDFMTSPSGGIDFGFVSEEAAVKLSVDAGPIRLQVGFPGPKGWGAKHVLSNEDRMARIKAIGFRGIAHYVETVARNFQRIADGGDGRLALVHNFQREGKESLDLEVIVLPKGHKGGTIWSVTTAIPKSVSRSKVLYSCPEKKKRPDGEVRNLSGGVSNRPRRETLSLPNYVTRDGKGS